jgi:ABC-type enterochelin transport system ATPase subunit
LSSIVCFEEAGKIRCESEEERRARELEEKLKQHLAELLSKLTQEYEIEVTIDIKEGKGVGKWRKKQQ